MLKQKITEELKNAMLARDTEKTSVLRMLKSAIGYFEIEKGGAGYTATDEDVMVVINKEAKQHKDSIDQFTAAKRLDLADRENRELKILQEYLPEQLPIAEIQRLVESTIKQCEASSTSDFGKVMGVLMPKVKGIADGGLVSRIVKEKLSS